jgi:hypothetical protein
MPFLLFISRWISPWTCMFSFNGMSMRESRTTDVPMLWNMIENRNEDRFSIYDRQLTISMRFIVCESSHMSSFVVDIYSRTEHSYVSMFVYMCSIENKHRQLFVNHHVKNNLTCYRFSLFLVRSIHRVYLCDWSRDIEFVR